ncbi:hypothetical protein D3C85_1470550 [compost metagenome]
MVEGVGDLLVGQPRVGGVQYCADARHGEEQLVVAMGVPGQRGHAVAGTDAEALQHGGRLRGAARQAAVVVAPQRLVDQPRDDLGVAMGAGGMGQDAADQQRGLLHQTFEHVDFLVLVVVFNGYRRPLAVKRREIQIYRQVNGA